MRTRVVEEPNQPEKHNLRSKKRMIRYRPSEMLAENFPAMQLVRALTREHHVLFVADVYHRRDLCPVAANIALRGNGDGTKSQ